MGFLKKLIKIDADTLNGQTSAGGGVNEDSILEKVYPVGSIYISVNDVNPGTLFGIGTWIAWGSGRVPVGVDTSQTEFNSVEKTGGEKSHILTIDEIPAHTHTQWSRNYSVQPITGGDVAANDSKLMQAQTGSTGGGTAHNNLQPYITCYMWKRTT